MDASDLKRIVENAFRTRRHEGMQPLPEVAAKRGEGFQIKEHTEE